MSYYPIVGFVLLEIVLALAGGLLTDVGPWYERLRKPSWNPPNWAFGPVWTVILTLAGASGVLAWNGADAVEGGHLRVAIYFGVNGVLHVAWSYFFFRRHRPDQAFVEVMFLWSSILAMVVGLAEFSALASWLVVPYIAWVTIAAYLNYTIVRLNAGPAGISSAA